MNRFCPRDRGELQVVPYAHQEMYRCASCAGLWMSGESFEKLFAGLMGSFKKVHPMEVQHRKSIKCPFDGSTMKVISNGRIELDTCFRCDGVWLDPQELEAMKKALKKRGDTPALLLMAEFFAEESVHGLEDEIEETIEEAEGFLERLFGRDDEKR